MLQAFQEDWFDRNRNSFECTAGMHLFAIDVLVSFCTGGGDVPEIVNLQ
jgi:hypothetical protein